MSVRLRVRLLSPVTAASFLPLVLGVGAAWHVQRCQRDASTALALNVGSFPKTPGKDYESTPYLDVFKDLRDDFTVVSGLSHPDVGPSHDSNYSFLTAAPHPERRAGFRNTISLD